MGNICHVDWFLHKSWWILRELETICFRWIPGPQAIHGMRNCISKPASSSCLLFIPRNFADFFVHFADFLWLKDFFELLLYTESPIYCVNFHIVTIYGTVSDKDRYVVGWFCTLLSIFYSPNCYCFKGYYKFSKMCKF